MNHLHNLPPSAKKRLHGLTQKAAIIAELSGDDDVLFLLQVISFLHVDDPTFPPKK